MWVFSDSIALSDRRCLLVAWLADFCPHWANVGLTGLPVNTQVRCRVLHIGRWANSGFLFKMAVSNNRGFWET